MDGRPVLQGVPVKTIALPVDADASPAPPLPAPGVAVAGKAKLRARAPAKPIKKWTPEEEAALRKGVERHSEGKWRIIKKDPELREVLGNRSNVDLKDKWRNLKSAARHALQLSRRRPAQEGDAGDATSSVGNNTVEPARGPPSPTPPLSAFVEAAAGAGALIPPALPPLGIAAAPGSPVVPSDVHISLPKASEGPSNPLALVGLIPSGTTSAKYLATPLALLAAPQGEAPAATAAAAQPPAAQGEAGTLPEGGGGTTVKEEDDGSMDINSVPAAVPLPPSPQPDAQGGPKGDAPATPESRGPPKGQKRHQWTEEEESALRAGVEKYGCGRWRKIQKDAVLGPALAQRSNGDLKDKWRNMRVHVDPGALPRRKKPRAAGAAESPGPSLAPGPAPPRASAPAAAPAPPPAVLPVLPGVPAAVGESCHPGVAAPAATQDFSLPPGMFVAPSSVPLPEQLSACSEASLQAFPPGDMPHMPHMPHAASYPPGPDARGPLLPMPHASSYPPGPPPRGPLYGAASQGMGPACSGGSSLWLPPEQPLSAAAPYGHPQEPFAGASQVWAPPMPVCNPFEEHRAALPPCQPFFGSSCGPFPQGAFSPRGTALGSAAASTAHLSQGCLAAGQGLTVEESGRGASGDSQKSERVLWRIRAVGPPRRPPPAGIPEGASPAAPAPLQGPREPLPLQAGLSDTSTSQAMPPAAPRQSGDLLEGLGLSSSCAQPLLAPGLSQLGGPSLSQGPFEPRLSLSHFVPSLSQLGSSLLPSCGRAAEAAAGCGLHEPLASRKRSHEGCMIF